MNSHEEKKKGRKFDMGKLDGKAKANRKEKARKEIRRE